MSVTLLIRNSKKNKKGLIPIYLRIIIARETKFISTGYFILPGQWDEKNERVKPSHASHAQINADITKKKNDALGNIVQSRMDGKAVDLQAVSPKTKKSNYFDFVDRFKTEVENKRNSATIENYRKHTKRLELFHGSRDLAFEQITPEYLTSFEQHLYKKDAEEKGVGGNYVHSLVKTIRTMFNAARKRGITSYYPFHVYEFPKYHAPNKDALSIAEVAQFEEFADNEANRKVLREAAIFLLLGIYTGLRVSDWYTFDIHKHIKKDMVLLRAKKNKQWVTMPVTEGLRRNLARIKEFPLTINEDTFNKKLKLVCNELNIKNKISTHTGRHTFAVTLCADRGVSCETCAELMGITVKTCLENYYKVTPEKILAETKRAWVGL